MKKETYANKLAALLGIDTAQHAHSFEEKPQPRDVSPKMRAIEEVETQNFRALEGLILFFKAPELFTPKTCKHCGEGFMVSRRNVAHCSMTCLKKEVESITGMPYTKADDPEYLVKAVWDGNEPLIVKNLDRIRKMLDAHSVPNVNSLNPTEQLVVTNGS